MISDDLDLQQLTAELKRDAAARASPSATCAASR